MEVLEDFGAFVADGEVEGVLEERAAWAAMGGGGGNGVVFSAFDDDITSCGVCPWGVVA